MVTQRGWRIWGDDRCDHCCNKDRCDDPTHFNRESCPYCGGSGNAIWVDLERMDFEHWYKKDVGEDSADLSRCNSGAYQDEDAQSCWEGWKARSRLGPPR